MTDLALQYAPLMQRMSQIYNNNHEIVQQFCNVTITAESWDAGRSGGHLGLTVPRDAPPIRIDSIQVWALDSDNTPIQIIWHVVDGRLNWGEWVKVAGTPITAWPPHDVSATAPTYRENGTPNLTNDDA